MGGEAHHEVAGDAPGRIPKFLLRCLPGWMEEYAGGPTIKQVAAATKLPVANVRLAFWEIRSENLAVVYKARDDHALHLAPLGYDYEAGDLSHNQEKVLGYLQTLPLNSDGTVTPPSKDAFHRETGVPVGSLGAAVDDLERKGKLAVVQRGSGPLQKPQYRVSHRQVLQKAIAEQDELARNGGVRDVSHLAFDDPSPSRRVRA